MGNETVRACFVLSAGRTGTVALATRLGELLPNTVVVHEPPPARVELLIGNLRNDTGFGADLARWLFLRTRRRRLERLPAGSGYVEINPLLCPIIDLLPALMVPFNVVHMVRQPAAWSQSITAFGASARYRAVIDFIPFAKPYPNPRPQGWRGMTEIERALWRWRVCNERILALRPQCAAYALVRYEDVFSSDPGRRAEAFGKVLRLMPGNPTSRMASIDPSERHNPRPNAKVAALTPEIVRMVCGDLAGQFGYDLG